MSRYINAELLIEAMRGRKFANDECVRHATDSPSKEYYRHLQFEDGIMMDFVREQLTAKVIPLDRIKEAKDAVENINPIYSTIGNRIPVLKNCDDIKTEVLAILDKLIAEVEG
jgi:hypothetical protein